jgi:FkbM family methyltransferase
LQLEERVERFAHPATNRCVYTCVIGDYEQLNEQAVAKESTIPFICLTDNARLTSETWKIIQVEPLFLADPIRSHRILKILPHRYLPNFDASLYIDNAVILIEPPENFLDEFAGDFSLPTHSFRDNLLGEFLEVKKLGFDDEIRINEYLNHVALTDPAALMERPYWAGMLYRNHRSETVRHALEMWAAHVLRYSRRDQLSANVVFRQSGLNPNRINIDNLQSRFHKWPSTIGRDYNHPLRRPRASLEAVEACRRKCQNEDEVAILDFVIKGQHSLKSELFMKVIHKHLATLRNLVAKVIRSRKNLSTCDFVKCTNGNNIYIDPADNRGVALVQSGGTLTPKTIEMWQLLLSEQDWTHIIDVGANYGELLISAELPSTARVIAVEPNSHLHSYLFKTLREAGVNATIISAAISDRSGEADLIVDRTWSGLTSLQSNLIETKGHRLSSLRVQTKTLDMIVTGADEHPMRVLTKIDVEGHDIAVLRGARTLMTRAADFVALIEILHLNDTDLNWMISEFVIELFDPQSKTFVHLETRDPAFFRREISARGLYPQDAVLRRRGNVGVEMLGE